MKDNTCAYCMQGELVAKFGYPICQMDSGYLYLFKEQSKRGRVILAYKDHVSEMVDISDEERNAFFADVNKVAKALQGIQAQQGELRRLRRHRLSPPHAPGSEVRGRRRVGQHLPDEPGQDLSDR